ncbi:GGDEF domain-containing protein [Turicibacter bilis]|uniref:GGDEF domain-containing protein n=1 Tax=Turicibacter bilis TaxID=2735723 RepID=UPI003F8A7AD7
MFETELINEIRERLSIFIGLYDSIRIVDPIKKELIKEEGASGSLELPRKGRHCYDFWDQDSVCGNCVSFMAYKNKKSTFKIERYKDGAYCIVALPIEREGRLYIVELLKKVIADDFFSDLSFNLALPLNTTTTTLTELANTDELTKVYNRRYFETQLAKEIMYSSFYETNLAVMIIDIDHFKQINDLYGHLVGDEVLKQFVGVIQSVLRQDIDWMSRYGGEEFVVVLKNVDFSHANKVAERIRQSVERHLFKIGADVQRLTCSIGLSMCQAGNLKQTELLQQADQKLYEAKNNGRNRVVS